MTNFYIQMWLFLFFLRFEPKLLAFLCLEGMTYPSNILSAINQLRMCLWWQDKRLWKYRHFCALSSRFLSRKMVRIWSNLKIFQRTTFNWPYTHCPQNLFPNQVHINGEKKLYYWLRNQTNINWLNFHHKSAKIDWKYN